MSGLVKVADGDGSFDIIASGSIVRTSLSSEDADAVMKSLQSMEPDEEYYFSSKTYLKLED